MRPAPRENGVFTVIARALPAFLGLLSVRPFLWMVMSTLKDTRDIFRHRVASA